MSRTKLLPAMGLMASLLGAQTGTKPVTSVGTTPGTPTSGTGAINLPGTSTPNTTQSTQTNTRPIFITGRVMMEDGLPLPLNVTIQRMCSGTPRTVAYADGTGGFSFRWGQTDNVMPDAAEAGSGNRSLTGLGGLGGTGSSGSFGGGPGSRSTFGCDLRANLAGYRSDTVSLSERTSLENVDVGVIVLHRAGKATGSGLVSASSLRAPKRAKKSYELGLQALMKNNPDRAARYFESAVAEYPGYADAWLSLGKLRRDQKSNEQARMALLKATAADPKMVSAFIELGLMASEERSWEDTVRYLDQATRLDPANYPVAWYTLAVADYNLNKYDDAEKNVRLAVRFDPKHGIPRVQYLLALILEEKKQFAAALIAFNSFLRYDPIAPDEAQVRAEVRRIEKMVGEGNQAAK